MSTEQYNFKILDCSLRDGGYVNDFAFGRNAIHQIVGHLCGANIDLIELGFLKDGEHRGGLYDKTLFNFVHEAEQYTRDNNNFCLMIRPDWYDISKLEDCVGNVTSLRFAFHYRDLDLALKQAQIAREKGYKVFLNPVNVLSYSDEILNELLPVLNDFKPKGVSIVDTFGSMMPLDLEKVFGAFNSKLDPSIAIGVHLHENLSISLALASNFVEMIKDSRPAYIDSSVLGIGRIPGNLCTELIANYLNLRLNKKYDLQHIYFLIDHAIGDIRRRFRWGYMPAYAITGFEQIHRSYAEYLMGLKVPLQDISNILNEIKENGDHEAFNESAVEAIYNRFLDEKSRQSF